MTRVDPEHVGLGAVRAGAERLGPRATRVHSRFRAVRVGAERFGLAHLRFHHERLPPGHRSSPPHRHTTREEVVYVLSGEPTLWQDGTELALTEGSVVGLPPGDCYHMLFNSTERDVELLVASAGGEGDRVEVCDPDPWPPPSD